MPPRQKLGWVVRAIPPSEGFGHVVELDNQKIVTLSRYLFQHVRPMSEVIQNLGNGFPSVSPEGTRYRQQRRLGCRTNKATLRRESPLTRGRRRISSERPPRREHAACPNFMWCSRKSAKKQLGDSSQGCRRGWRLQPPSPGCDFPEQVRRRRRRHRQVQPKNGASLRARTATRTKKGGEFREPFAIDDKWTEQPETESTPQTSEELV